MRGWNLFIKIVASVAVMLLLVAVVANVATWLLNIPSDAPHNTALFVRITAAALVVVLLGLWLARDITRPVARIRRASQQIAAGQLTARVAEAFGRGTTKLVASDRTSMRWPARSKPSSHLSVACCAMSRTN